MFPEMKKVGRWIFSKSVPDGWEDRGEVKDYPDIVNGKQVTIKNLCPDCNTRLRVGRQYSRPFVYCSMCLVKLVQDKEKEP